MIAIASHHRRLERRDREETARLLVLARGYHGAVDACLRNGWEEILALLLAGAAGAAPGRRARGDEFDDCRQEADGQRRIRGCSKIIGSNSENQKNRRSYARKLVTGSSGGTFV